jgi:hypothetical protein
MKIRATCLTPLTFTVVLFLGTNAEAQKIKMPREGTLEWEFSLAAPVDMPVATKELTLAHYVSRGNIKAIPEGGPFDRQSGTCWGTFVINGGKAEEMGFCEVVDLDSDKWYIHYHGNPEGTGGTYSAVYGTGKYAGMVMNAEYHYPVNPWPVTVTATGTILNNRVWNKGTYKLAQ